MVREIQVQRLIDLALDAPPLIATRRLVQIIEAITEEPLLTETWQRMGELIVYYEKLNKEK